MRAVALAVVLAALGAGEAMAEPPSREPVLIEVNGAAIVSVVPDEATVVVAVSGTEETSAVATERNAHDVARVGALLKGLGVADKDVQSEAVRVMPRRGPTTYPLPGDVRTEQGTPSPTVTGFLATTRIEVRFTDLAKAAQFAEQARANGASAVNPIQYRVLDPAAGAELARRAALDAARRKAEGLAAMAGLKLGRMVRISIPSRDLFSLLAGASSAIASGPQSDDVVRIRTEMPAGIKPVDVRASLDVSWNAE